MRVGGGKGREGEGKGTNKEDRMYGPQQGTKMCQRECRRSKSRPAGYCGSKGRDTGREKLPEWEKLLRDRTLPLLFP